MATMLYKVILRISIFTNHHKLTINVTSESMAYYLMDLKEMDDSRYYNIYCYDGTMFNAKSQ